MQPILSAAVDASQNCYWWGLSFFPVLLRSFPLFAFVTRFVLRF
jgi:hypothetical protein